MSAPERIYIPEEASFAILGVKNPDPDVSEICYVHDDIVQAMLAAKDAELARVREAATSLAKWVICNIPSAEVVDEKLRALDAALTEKDHAP